MRTLLERPDSELATLRVAIIDFAERDAWKALVGLVLADRERILKTLTDATVAGEQLKYAQGELAQANRDILLVERLSRAIDVEIKRRQHAVERT